MPPKFNCNLMDGVVVLTLNGEMLKRVLAIIDELEPSELSREEYAMFKRLETIHQTIERKHNACDMSSS